MLLVLAFLGCQEIGEPEPVPVSSEIRIERASEEQMALFGNWLGQGNENARIAGEFDPSELVRISDGEYSRWAVPSNKDSNTSLSFVFDPLDNIAKPFISTSVRTSNGGISSTIYDVQHKNIAEIDHRPDGTFTVKYGGGNRPHGGWREWDDCLGTVGAPFPSNFANIVFETVATVSTGGLWVPSLFLVCAGVASGRNYQNRN